MCRYPTPSKNDAWVADPVFRQKFCFPRLKTGSVSSQSWMDIRSTSGGPDLRCAGYLASLLRSRLRPGGDGILGGRLLGRGDSSGGEFGDATVGIGRPLVPAVHGYVSKWCPCTGKGIRPCPSPSRFTMSTVCSSLS